MKFAVRRALEMETGECACQDCEDDITADVSRCPAWPFSDQGQGLQNSVPASAPRKATSIIFTTSIISVATEQSTSVDSMGQARFGSTMAGCPRNATLIVWTTSVTSSTPSQLAGSAWQLQAHSQASPTRSPSVSSWPGFGTVGQLSPSLGTPSPSVSLGAASRTQRA